MKHKHAGLIKAWADGESIEFYNKIYDRWQPVPTSPSWKEDIEYRVVDKFRELKDAHANGSKIEIKFCDSWYSIANPTWNTLHDYRIKPEPKLEYVPFNFSDAEFLIGKMVKENGDGKFLSIIIGVFQDGFMVGNKIHRFDTLLKEFIFLDGTPCGKIKQ